LTSGAGKPPPDPEAFRRFEHSGWVEVAGRYHDSFSRLTNRAIEPLLAAVAAGEGVELLDVAAGPGDLVAAAALRGALATGVGSRPCRSRGG
jgi:hypothetical protein